MHFKPLKLRHEIRSTSFAALSKEIVAKLMAAALRTFGRFTADESAL